MDQLRARRDEAVELETTVSYLRRIAQGRLDILRAEQRRRTTGEAPAANLVDDLSDILADRTRSGGPARLGRLHEPDPTATDTAELDAIVPPSLEAGSLDEADLDARITRLLAYDERVSTSRRALFERIDLLQAEITRRYRTGEASVETLLQ